MKKHAFKRGMTLVETLTALAIFSILTVAILYGTSSAMKVYRNGTQSSEARALIATLTESISDELRYAQNVTVDKTTGNVMFDSTQFGGRASITLDDTTKGGHVIVRVGTKTYDLIGDKAYTNGMWVQDLKITYDAADQSFTLEFTVKNNAKLSQSTKLTVSAMNPS